MATTSHPADPGDAESGDRTADALGLLEEVIWNRRSSLRVDPDRAVPRELVERLCRLASWAPNHHRTRPWRFCAVTGPARHALGEALAEDLLATGEENPAKVAKARTKYARAPLVLVVTADAGADVVTAAKTATRWRPQCRPCSSAPPQQDCPPSGRPAPPPAPPASPPPVASPRTRPSSAWSTWAGRTPTFLHRPTVPSRSCGSSTPPPSPGPTRLTAHGHHPDRDESLRRRRARTRRLYATVLWWLFVAIFVYNAVAIGQVIFWIPAVLFGLGALATTRLALSPRPRSGSPPSPTPSAPPGRGRSSRRRPTGSHRGRADPVPPAPAPSGSPTADSPSSPTTTRSGSTSR